MGGGGDGGGGDDLISGLGDDMLVRILELVPDARAVVRTDALSRRWRGLWTRVAALRFTSNSWPAYCEEASVAKQYVAFVDGVLAIRAKAATTTRCCAAVEDLKISLDTTHSDGRKIQEPVTPSVVYQAARGWIHYGVQHEVKSLVLDMNLIWPYEHLRRPKENYDGENVGYDEDYDENVKHTPVPATMALDDLATSAKLETMHFKLGGAKLRLLLSYSTAVFSSLIDVSLDNIVVASHLLSRLVCCPRLRKLRLYDVHLCRTEDLLLESDTLLELSLRQMWNMQSIELRTPSLQVLHFGNCIYLKCFTVSAPRLEDLMFEAHKPLHIVDVHHHLSIVGTLKIHLNSHGNINGNKSNDTSIHLLQCCGLTKRLEVSLKVLEKKFRSSDIIKGRIPSLPHVTSLRVQITMGEPHSFGASIASLLAQCNNIRYLSLQFHYMNIKKEQHYFCDNSCQWKSHEFSLAHLQEVEFKWLIGTDCELEFIQYVLARETRIQKVTIGFSKCWWLKDKEDTFKILTPLLDGGSWTTSKNDTNSLLYKWRRCCL